MEVERTAYGPAALYTLTRVVGGLKAEDPMRPVTVLVPSSTAGVAARRFLARGVAGRPGVAALDVTTVPRWAEQLAAPRLAPRRPATRSVLTAAIRGRLAERDGPLTKVAAHPATVQAVVGCHAELSGLDELRLDAVAGASEVSAEVVAVHRAVRRGLAAEWYEPVDLVRAAAARVAEQGLDHDVVLHLPQRLTPAEVELLQQVAGHRRLTVVAGLGGEPRADDVVEELLQQLGVVGGDEPVSVGAVADGPGHAPVAGAGSGFSPATASRLLTASDADDEVRCVVRDLVTTLGGTRADRVAVLYSARSPYARLLHEQLAGAGIAVNGPGTRSVAERALARLLLEVLALAGDELGRRAFFEALSHTGVRDGAGGVLPLTQWERLSRAAGVVRGEDWSRRLTDLAADRRAEAAKDGVEGWLAERHRGEADRAEALSAFAVGLAERLRQGMRLTRWVDLARWCTELFTDLVGQPAELRRLPAEEQYAAATITTVLGQLAELDAVDHTASLESLRDLLTVEFEQALPRVRRFGEGVLVAPLSSAVGLDLDAVYLVGLSEDLFPGRVREDALLGEEARALAPAQLITARQRIDAQHRQLLAGLAAAPVVVACFARGDLRRSTRRLPSRWLLPTLRSLAGDPELAASDWESAGLGEAHHQSGSFAGELLSAPRLANPQEWRVRAAVAGLLPDPVVEAAALMLAGRAGESFTRFDGHVGGVEGLPDHAQDDLLLSPTSLEIYAECPHRYLVQRLLGIEPLTQPEDVVQISPLDLGTLVHESLDEFISEQAELDALPGFGQPWTPVQGVRLAEISRRRAEEMERRGLTGHPRLWRRDQDRVALAMAEWRTADDAERARTDARVVASELAFGMRGEAPVVVELDEGRLLMRGSADKVDQGRDGTLYVTDIKTGSSTKFRAISQASPLADGSKLQLPVYGYAARQRLGPPQTPVVAGYWFVLREHKRIVVELTADVERQYREVLGVLTRSVAAGLFPPRPPEKDDFAWVQCAWCNPDGVGYGGHRDRWQRKRRDPVLAGLVALLEPEGGTP